MLVFLRRNTRIHKKMGEIHELFVLALRVLEKGSQKGSEKGAFFYGFYSKNGFLEGFSEVVLRRGFPEGAQNASSESTTLRRAPDKKSPRNGQHPEPDQNEIRTRYGFASYEAIEGQDRVARQDAPIFLVGAPDVLKHLKTETHA